jgi:hypothetical protein
VRDGGEGEDEQDAGWGDDGRWETRGREMAGERIERLMRRSGGRLAYKCVFKGRKGNSQNNLAQFF